MPRRFVGSLLGLVLVVSACGDAPLSGLGNASEWIGEPNTTVAVQVTAPIEVSPLRSVTEAAWFNEPAAVLPSDPDAVVEAVWSRSNGTDAFVQAAPNEIAAALPGLLFPGQVPAETQHITSQLVFSTRTGTLASTLVAAFGLWSREPYTTSYSVSQLAVLRVARDSTFPDVELGDATEGCGRFGNRSDLTSCERVVVADTNAWWVDTLDGSTLIWYADGYRYEYFDRARVGREVVEDIVRSQVALAAMG